MATKEFKVVAISDNRNSFGLRGVVVVARDGEAWQMGGNDLICERHPVDSVFLADPLVGFTGYEIPHTHPSPPTAVLATIWPDAGNGEAVFVLACHDCHGLANIGLLFPLTRDNWEELSSLIGSAGDHELGDRLRKVEFEWRLPLQWVSSGFVACLDQREYAVPTAYTLPSQTLRDVGWICYREMPIELNEEVDLEDDIVGEVRLVLSFKDQVLRVSWHSAEADIGTTPVPWTVLCDCRDRALRPASFYDPLCRP